MLLITQFALIFHFQTFEVRLFSIEVVIFSRETPIINLVVFHLSLTPSFFYYFQVSLVWCKGHHLAVNNLLLLHLNFLTLLCIALLPIHIISFQPQGFKSCAHNFYFHFLKTYLMIPTQWVSVQSLIWLDFTLILFLFDLHFFIKNVDWVTKNEKASKIFICNVEFQHLKYN